MSPLELFLLQNASPAVAKQVAKRIASPSFPRRVLREVKRYENRPPITRSQARAIRKLLKTEVVWLLLLDSRNSSTTDLTEIIATNVFPDMGHDRGDSLWLAQAIRAATPGALDPKDQANLVVSTIRDVGEDVQTTFQTLSGITQDVGAIKDIVSAPAKNFDPEILVHGPLVTLGLQADYERAEGLAPSQPEIAVEIFASIIDHMSREGYQPLTRGLRVRLAELQSSMGHVLAAAEAWTDLVIETIDRGVASNDTSPISSLEALAGLPEAPAWLPHRKSALSASLAWHYERNATGAEVMQYAVSASTFQDPRAVLLLRLAAEACLASGNLEDIAARLEVLRPASRSSLTEDGVRLRLAIAEVTRSAEDWDELDALATPGVGKAQVREAALILARHARFLLFTDNPAAAAGYFSRAVERGCRASLWQDAAAWTNGRIRALIRSGAFGNELNQLALQASSIRATGNTGLIMRGYDARAAAMDDILAGKLSAALPSLRRHLRDSMWAAHVEAEISGHRLLGDLYARTEREDPKAIRHFVAAGDGKRAAKIARDVEFFDLKSFATSPDPAVREATFTTVVAMTDVIPDRDVAEWVELCVGAISDRSNAHFSPVPWVPAFELVADLAIRGMSNSQLDRILDAIDALIPRQVDRYTYADDSIVRFIANASISMPHRRLDLADRAIQFVNVSRDMSKQLELHRTALDALGPFVDSRLLEMAADGSQGALNLLACRQLNDPLLRSAAELRIEASIASGAAYSDNAVSMLADVTGAVKFSYAATPELRDALARDFARRAADAKDLESNRAQAASAVGMLAEQLPSSTRIELFEIIEPLTLADAPQSPFDETNKMFDHPLGNFRINVAVGQLRRAAVSTLAALALDDASFARSWELAQPLLRSSSQEDHLTAARVIYALGAKGMDAPFPWALLATSANPRLRQAAAALLGTATAIDQAKTLVLASDSTVAVRREIATALPNILRLSPHTGAEIRQVLERDPSFSVRNHLP